MTDIPIPVPKDINRDEFLKVAMQAANLPPIPTSEQAARHYHHIGNVPIHVSPEAIKEVCKAYRDAVRKIVQHGQAAVMVKHEIAGYEAPQMDGGKQFLQFLDFDDYLIVTSNYHQLLNALKQDELSYISHRESERAFQQNQEIMQVNHLRPEAGGVVLVRNVIPSSA